MILKDLKDFGCNGKYCGKFPIFNGNPWKNFTKYFCIFFCFSISFILRKKLAFFSGGGGGGYGPPPSKQVFTCPFNYMYVYEYKSGSLVLATWVANKTILYKEYGYMKNV